MRVPWLIALLVGGVAGANPIPVPESETAPLNVYLASEKLVVTISSTDAMFAATFTFRYHEGSSKVPVFALPRAVVVELPIWFPEAGSADDRRVEKFWRTFEKGKTYDLSTHEAARGVFDSSVALKIRARQSGVMEAPSPLKFLTVPGDCGRRVSEGRLYERGFCCLVLPLSFSPGVLWHAPINISYRHPLARSNGEGRFFYLPIFENLPDQISTADNNRYAITIEATPDCSLTVSSGDQKIRVESGRSGTISPNHLLPIRAVSKPMATPPAP